MLSYVIVGLVVFAVNAILCGDSHPISHYVIASVIWPVYLTLMVIIAYKSWKEKK